MIRDIENWMAALAGKTPDEAAAFILGDLTAYPSSLTQAFARHGLGDRAHLANALRAWGRMPHHTDDARTMINREFATDQSAPDFGRGDGNSATLAALEDFVQRGANAQAAVNAVIGGARAGLARDAERQATEAEAALGISINWETAPHVSAKKAAMADVPREAGTSGSDRLYVKRDDGRQKTFRGFVNGVRVVAAAPSLEDAKTGVERAYRADRLKGEVPGRARAVQS